jgi:isopentenyldiphosphate isomerase
MGDDEELLDIVDGNDLVVGSLSRGFVYSQNLRNFRTVNLFALNENSLIITPRRSLSKKMFPGSLDFSVGGHVCSGETYDTAIIRELKEELGVELPIGKVTSLGKLTPLEHGVSSFMMVYMCRLSSGDIGRLSAEHMEISLFRFDDLVTRIKEESFTTPAKDDFLPVLKSCEVYLRY